ncbi:MAG: helix-turn-helix transcriptional regulator [Candidatus Nealsonbacteria bacterium]|nr:helix-turn-helix transcriptional regulator [Candidatus Nealsonbacteria bacterium]
MGKRITRDRRLTEAEKARYGKIREQIAEELPEIRQRAKVARRRILLKQLLKALKEERQRQGMSLGDLKQRSGIDRGSLSKLENDPDPNVTVNTLLKYAEAVGKTITVQLEDIPSVEPS